ncbi:oligopeptide transport system permease protein [Metamycoplasma subdolum]|uniref:Oligopeptide transport system permease protein n=1 Tax=Metamycoplasma subdolum TaxID=92407 RepID=A0A3M0A722_9BACT|nr:ABC transporter permease [Metamycoplasma subdolum]RMA78608.1 oligopeptide transport system permease protein [Metamycoplasma subdolum]WPB50257.1 ABC transporter permease [Metamycoplasma subdolum]
MAQSVKEFNEQYKISKDLATKFSFIKEGSKQNVSSIAGKPKKLVQEIFKRFFTNPVVVIATVVFITILLMSIIIPLPGIRNYTPNRRVSDVIFVEYLPPLSRPLKTVAVSVDDEIYKHIENLRKSPFHDYYAFFLNTVSESGAGVFFNLTYDGYKLYSATILNSKLVALQASGQTITQDVVNDILNNQIVPLKTILGTNQIGADIWTTTWYATWRAVKIALIVVAAQTFIGVAIGAYLGFHAGKLLDTICMRIIEIFQAPPYLIWLLMFVSFFGTNDGALIASLIIIGWPWPVYTTRLFVITVKNEEYITVAKSIGASTSRQVFVHALPAILGKISTAFVRSVPGVIVSVASLAFLGFFKETKDTNLGQLLFEAIEQSGTNVWILLLPALILLFISLSLQFIALGVHDALDPKVLSKGKRK